MTVNNVNALLTYAAGQTDVSGARQAESAKDAFSQIMSKANDTISSLKTDLAGNAAVSNQTVVNQTAEQAVTSKENVKVENSNQQTTDSDKINDTKTDDAMQKDCNDKVANDDNADAEMDQAAEEVEKAGEQLVQDIAKEMDVTPEEVEEAMAVLGLTAVDLFDISNLKQLLLQISGSTDDLSLVTNETLYGNLQNLLTTVEESLGSLQEELGMSEEELSALMEKMVSDSQESGAQNADLMQETPEPDQTGMKDYTVSVQRDGETVQLKVTVDDASGSKSVREEVTDAPRAEVQLDERMRGRDAFADGGRGESGESAHAFLQNFNQAVETEETPAVPADVSYQSAQTEEIMNQIVEHMKINLKPESQQMELQLHPASLGTVNVHLASKDGVITAQFTTQNETVRAVIETQLIQLKNQFEEQGIKVDAVEVTVANHEYGQQFSQEQENAEQKQGKSAKSTRRINLDEIDEDAELDQMDDSERIAVEMMQANGNTVDYTA